MANEYWNSSLYDTRHRFVSDLARDLVALVDPKPGQRILDIGCGTGHLTAELAASGASVLGIDQSTSMIESARQSYPQLDLLVDDIVTTKLSEPFDVIFSNATFHWIEQIEQAVSNIARILKPSGKLVVEFGGKGNIHLIMHALDDALAEMGLPKRTRTMYFPSIAEFGSLLEQHHLEVTQALLFDRPTPLEGSDGMLNWLSMFASIKVDYLSEIDRQRVFESAVSKLKSQLFRDGTWYADYRRLRIVAQRAST